MNKKLIALTLTALGIGIAGLTLLGYGRKFDHQSAWFHLATHTFSLLASVGLVGFIFEAVFRGHALLEFANQVRELFDGDRRLAAALSQDARQKRVQHTLQAQLGDEIGNAIYDGLVGRYLSREPSYRKDFYYEVVISDPPEDVHLGTDIVLSKANYYRLTITQHFLRPFRHTHTARVGCIFVDDFAEVNYWFNQDDCIFRDTVVLLEPDRNALKEHLGAVPFEEVLPYITPILKVDKIAINGTTVEVQSASLAPSGNSAGIRLKVPKSVARDSTGSGVARYEITITGLIARDSRQYPVIFGEPTRDPEIVVIYQATDIERVVAAPFFSGRLAFNPTIEVDTYLRKVRVALPRIGEDHTWVFPSSGAVFLWDRRHKV